MNNLTQQLREHRQRLHLTQAQVAERADMRLNRYGDYERGKCGMTLATLERIATALGVRLAIVNESEER